MGLCGSKQAAPSNKANKEGKFIAETIIEKTGIADFDTVIAKADDPLAGIIGINNQLQTAIEQLMAAGSALFGANLSEASIKDGKLSFEIYKPPQEDKDKKIIIAVVTGERKGKEPKDQGIEVKDPNLYAELKKNDELLDALMDANAQVGAFNACMKRKEFKGVKVIVHCNRVKVDMAKPMDMKELAKINMVKQAVNSFNASFFPVKSGLAKAAFKDGLDIGKIVKQIMDKLKEALKDKIPTVKVDMANLMEGKLDFQIGLPDVPDINEFFEADSLIPPMLKNAWKRINGKGGLVECLKECASKLKELKPQIEEAINAVKELPTDPNKIKEASKKALTDKKITPFDVPKIPGKMKGNGEQLGRTPQVLQDVVNNLKSTVEELVEALKGAGQDAGSGNHSAVLGTVTGAVTDLSDTVNGLGQEEPATNGETAEAPQTKATTEVESKVVDQEAKNAESTNVPQTQATTEVESKVVDQEAKNEESTNVPPPEQNAAPPEVEEVLQAEPSKCYGCF